MSRSTLRKLCPSCTGLITSCTHLGVSLLVIYLAAGELFAQSKYAGESFSVGVGARGLGMGSAFHTLATGPEALYWNPAGLARTDIRGAR